MINWDKGKAVTFLLESLGEYFLYSFPLHICYCSEVYSQYH